MGLKLALVGCPASGVSVSRVSGYVVYLFHVSDPVVHLSINQGTTAVREEFGARAREILQNRADLMRKRISEYSDALPVSKIDLGSNARLPGDYAAGHALGITSDISCDAVSPLTQMSALPLKADIAWF